MPAGAILSLLLSGRICVVMSLVRFVSCPGNLIFLQFPHLLVVLGLYLSPSTCSPRQIPDRGTQLPSTGARQDSMSLQVMPWGVTRSTRSEIMLWNLNIESSLQSPSGTNVVCLHLPLLSDLILGEEIIPKDWNPWYQLLLFQGTLKPGLAENDLLPSSLS